MSNEILENINILYVEDEDSIREFILPIFQKLTKKVVEAENGLIGLEKFKERFNNKEKENFDIVVTDINMPKMDGFNMCEKIKEIDSLIPIVITTAYSNTEFLQDAIKLGVRGYVIKPIKLQQLIECIGIAVEPRLLQKRLNTINNTLREQSKIAVETLAQERRKYEKNIIENTQFSPIDEVAIGVTSEINTPLAYVKGAVEISRYDLEDMPDNEFKQRLLDDNKNIMAAINKVDIINKQLQARVEIEVEKNREKDKQLFEQSKMVSMSEMIGNIAHQWRQPLSSISTAASGMNLESEMGILNDKMIKHYTEGIVKNTQYLSETIDIFRDFIKEKKELKDVVLQDRVNTVISIIRDSLKNQHIEFKNQIESNPIYITMIVGELDQIIINILNNAKDVLLEKDIKKPWIKLNVIKENNKAIITIEDNAGGIPDDIMPRIFDPYFTTKHQFQGTGLGLHMSYKIIMESLKGRLYAKNTNSGAKFFIELPLG